MLKDIVSIVKKKKECTKALGTIHEITISVKEFKLFMNSSGMDGWSKETTRRGGGAF